MSAPRFFREVGSNSEWTWNGTVMGIRDMNRDFSGRSIFTSPADLLAEHGVYECDAAGNPTDPTAADIAAERGDRQQQQEADES